MPAIRAERQVVEVVDQHVANAEIEEIDLGKLADLPPRVVGKGMQASDNVRLLEDIQVAHDGLAIHLEATRQLTLVDLLPI